MTTLDQALGDWAARHQLTEAQSSAIRARIQAESGCADVEWLWDCFDQ